MKRIVLPALLGLGFVTSAVVTAGTSFAATMPPSNSPASEQPTTVNPDGRYCPPGAYYYVDNNDGWSIAAVPASDPKTYSDYNNTPYAAYQTLTATSGGTRGVSVSVGGTFDIDAIVAGAQASTSFTLMNSATADVGNSFEIEVPSHDYGNGQYGVWRLKTYGEYYVETTNCFTQNAQYFYTWVPRNDVGWDGWVSTTPGGPAI